MAPNQIFLAIFLGISSYLLFFLGMQAESSLMTGWVASQSASALQQTASGMVTVVSVLTLIGRVWFIARAFKESVSWGLAVLFLPLADGFYAVKFWEAAKTPFLIFLLACLLAGVSCDMTKAAKDKTESQALKDYKVRAEHHKKIESVEQQLLQFNKR